MMDCVRDVTPSGLVTKHSNHRAVVEAIRVTFPLVRTSTRHAEDRGKSIGIGALNVISDTDNEYHLRHGHIPAELKF